MIAPIATSRDGETYNVNADTFAGAIAVAMKAKRLLLLTDVAGVLDKDKQPDAGADARPNRPTEQRRHHFRRHDPQAGKLCIGGARRR